MPGNEPQIYKMSDNRPPKEPARLIIPAWGDVYVSKLTTITLPAALASGNLPALSKLFDVELAIVTESRLFEAIRDSEAYIAATKVCAVRLVALDDIMTNRSVDYGMMLTYALFRGFADLGTRMTETYLLFLNADFILSDGSLRHLGKLMCEGRRVIHSPSFRVVLEQVWPQLVARVDKKSCTLSLSSKEMARLALVNRHRTVQARTVNQRLCHQVYQDQFYWYVDEETLIGYQWPVALVAIKPERVITGPVMFWDFAFVPEAAPTTQPYFIGDSDDFFMIEPQNRNSGQDMIRIGTASMDEIVSVLRTYATKEHRESGKQLLTIHSGDLPSNLQEVINQSRSYMAEIFRRLPPDPVAHVDHPQLGAWFEEARRRRLGSAPALVELGYAARSKSQTPLVSLLFLLQRLHRRLFGIPPRINRAHPFWVDTAPVVEKITSWLDRDKKRVLWIGSVDSQFAGILEQPISLTALLSFGLAGSVVKNAPFDACLCELSLADLLRLKQLYATIRPLIRNGGEIAVSIIGDKGVLDPAASILRQADYPYVDVSEIHFFGTIVTAALRKIALPALRPIPTRALARALIVSSLFFVSPLAWLANLWAERRISSKFSPAWTSILINFTVRRRQACDKKSSHSSA